MGAQPMPFPSDHPTNRLDHDPRTALRGPAYEWPLWSTTMRVVTADSHAPAVGPPAGGDGAGPRRARREPGAS